MLCLKLAEVISGHMFDLDMSLASIPFQPADV